MSPGDGMAIELSGLTKVFRHRKKAITAVQRLSLAVPAGQVAGLLGPNGAGKTTTIKMICGLISPTAGTARLNGYDVARRRAAAVRQVGAVLEGSRNVYWPLSAWQNLLYFGRLKGLTAHEIKPRAVRLLTELELWDRRHETVGSYSRGMQQKVAIAAALITDPPIILLDEPTIGLDVDAARTVKDWITRLARDEGKTVLLTTHQLAVAQELSARIVVMKSVGAAGGGSVVADLPTLELLSRFGEDRFTVHVVGTLNGFAGPMPAGARIDTGAGSSRIVLPGTSQDVLQDLLRQLWDRGIPLAGVTSGQPDLEEVYLHLVRDSAGRDAAVANAAGPAGLERDR